MSANLWDVSTGTFKPDASGVYLVGWSTGGLQSAIAGTSALTENQTVHMGASLKGAGAGVLKPFVEYRDAAGNKNWVGFLHWQPTDSWQRFEGTCVVPSGMTITYVGFNNSAATGDIQVANPVFSYGSPVTLATAAHTPYATQDHVAAEYATKAALKVTSDAVTAEVTERGKLAGRVGTLESTANDVDKRLKSVESDYVTSATLSTTKESIEADISSTLTESKKYTDDSITTEVTNRNAAITAKADEINSSVEKTYITKDDAQDIYSTKTELDQTAETISSSVSKKVSIGENGTVSDLSSVMEQSADGVLVKFSKTVGEQTFQPAIELTTDSDYDNASTVNAAIKMWESLSIRNSGGTPVTEINGPTMKINKVVVVDSIRIGTWLLASRSETTTSGSSEIIEIRSI